MKIKFKKKWLIYFVTFIVILNFKANEKLDLLWFEKTYENSFFNNNIIVIKDSILYINISEKLSLTNYDLKNGNKIWEKEISTLGDNSLFDKNLKISDIVYDDKENIYICVEHLMKGTFILKFNLETKLIFYIKVSKKYPVNKNSFCFKLIIKDNFLYLLGNHYSHKQDLNIWSCKLTLDMNKVCETVYKSNLTENITDAFVNDKSEIILIGNSGRFDKFGGGPSTVLILKYNEELNVLELLTSFKGKNAKCVQNINNNCLVFNKSSIFPKQNIKVKFFKKDFSLLKEFDLYKNEICTSNYFLFKENNRNILYASFKNKQFIFNITLDKNNLSTTILSETFVLNIKNAFVKDNFLISLTNWIEHPKISKEERMKFNPITLIKSQLSIYNKGVIE